MTRESTSRPWLPETPFETLGPLSQVINLTGTSAVETDYIVPLNVHYGARAGDYTIDDIYLNGGCNTDFSDLRFTDSLGNRLNYYVHSHGNYELIPDSTNLGDTNIILANGDIVASNVAGVTQGIARSEDNGLTWTILNSERYQILWVDPITGYYFASGIYADDLIRSIDNGASWVTVLDVAALSAFFLPYGFCEDDAGTLFAGQYQTPLGAKIYRSLDGGATWDIIYNNVNKQHVHGAGVDPYTGYLYAGIDGGDGRRLIRSVNATDVAVIPANVVFTELVVSDAVMMIFGDGWRMFSNEDIDAAAGVLTSTVFRTTDDATFTSEIKKGKGGYVLRKVGSNIYLTSCAVLYERYPAVMRRNADSTWTTIWQAKYDTTAGNAGLRWAESEGTPTGGESQLIVGYAAGPVGYKTHRLYDGGDHYQALVYVKVPTLAATGGLINIHYGAPDNVSRSSISTYSPGLVQAGLLAHYKLDEGGSGTVITDETANNKTAALTPGTGSWNALGGRRAGALIPDPLLAGRSYHFNGDGYIRITGSDTDADFQFTNNFAVSLWFRTSNDAVQWLIGKGARSGNNWGILATNDTNFLRFDYSATPHIHYPAQYMPTWNGEWYFVCVSISAADKITWCVNGFCYPEEALDQAITANNGLISIGADSEGASPLTGDIDDIQFYPTSLTNTKMRQLYEDRVFATIEPEIYIPTSCVLFNGTTTEIDAGSHASLADIPDGAFTIEGWYRPDSAGEGNLGTLFAKLPGFQMLYTNATMWDFFIYAAVTNSGTSPVQAPDTGWHHIAATFDDGGDRKIRAYIDGYLVGTGIAAVGAYTSEAAKILRIGYSSAAGRHIEGAVGWVRVSNVVRWNNGFVPIPRHLPPAVDVNTVRLFKMDEGTGTVITDYSANAQNATLANGVWTVA